MFNPSTYPNFLHFLALYPTLQFAVQSTEMTFSVSRDGGKFEWAGTGLAAVFCQMGRVLDQRMWRMLYDIMRFNACAGRLLVGSDGKGSETKEVSIGTYLEHEGYSDAFRDDYLLVSRVFMDEQLMFLRVRVAHDRCDMEHASGQMRFGLSSANLGGRDYRLALDCIELISKF